MSVSEIVRDRLTTIGLVPRTYLMGSVPTSPVYPYAVVAAGFSRATTYTLDANYGVGDYRITTQSFGRTLVSAQATDDAARNALLDQWLTIPGLNTGPIRGQVLGAVVRDPDTQGVIGVTSTYLFTTTKES